LAPIKDSFDAEAVLYNDKLCRQNLKSERSDTIENEQSRNKIRNIKIPVTLENWETEISTKNKNPRRKRLGIEDLYP